jgi:hypothetical protein
VKKKMTPTPDPEAAFRQMIEAVRAFADLCFPGTSEVVVAINQGYWYGT